ncbi:MAG: protein involved in polysaccharide export with SLBB domain [Candidatus Azotimanducaceae bacterium]
MLRTRLFLIALPAMVIAFSALSGCGGSSSGEMIRSNYVEFTPDQKQSIQDRAGREYRIQEGDILKVAFMYLKDLNQEGVVVLGDGAVNLLGVDRIKVAGFTMSEADSMLTQAYSREYRDPNLSVLMQESRGRRVYVMGEVRNPGMHHVPTGGVGMLGAISVAGGFSDDAAAEGSMLVRISGEGYLVQEVDLSEFGQMENAALALVDIQAYDVIYVPRSRIGDFGYFARNVLSGLVQITRIATDLTYVSGGNIGRF